MNEFYVTLQSDANPEEFPENTSTAFKARLPQALNFKDEAWEVGVTGLCLPDGGFTIASLLDSENFPFQRNETLLHQTFWKEILVPVKRRHQDVEKQWRQDEAIAWPNNPEDYVVKNGTEFMEFLLSQIIRSIALNTKYGENHFFEDGQYSITHFEWTSMGLKVAQLRDKGNNNKAAHVRFAVNAELAQAMGWFVENRDGSFRMGKNLDILSQVYPVPYGHEDKWQIITKSHMGILVKFIALSPFCTWQFVNLDEAFHRYIGSPSQSLVVYSDVAGSRVVGSDIVNVIREVDYQRKNHGCVNIEPRHIQYVPVRNKIVETIETTLKVDLQALP